MSPLLLKGLIGAGLSLGGVGLWQLHDHMTPRTLGDCVLANGHIFHPFEGNINTGGWDELAKAYKDNSNDNPLKFNDLTMSGDPSETEISSLRNKCKTLAQKELGGDNEAQEIKQLEKWCVITKASHSITTVKATQAT